MDPLSKKNQTKVEIEKEENHASSSTLENEVDEFKEEDVQKINVIEHIHSKEKINEKKHAGVISDPNSLLHQLGRDVSIHCLIHLSRSYYGSIALLNKSFRSLIRTGELYEMRRKSNRVENWIYFSTEVLKWEAFDPNRRRWMDLPRMTGDECFISSDKESLAVGTELLVFGKEAMAPIVYKYSLLTNTWSTGKMLNTPRCLFGSASLGEIAIVAGGCDPFGNVLSSAELYNSETGTWENLPNMNTARKMCSAVFMNGRFYVLGGIAEDKKTILTSGEEFDLKTKEWNEIPDMYLVRNEGNGVFDTPPSFGSPPLIAVVNNVLYAIKYAEQEVKKYVKENNSWVTIGKLPEQATSMNGWGLAFRACGDMLVVLGGPILPGRSFMEINGWIPDDGAPQWNLLGRKQSGGFVLNCTVMGC